MSELKRYRWPLAVAGSAVLMVAVTIAEIDPPVSVVVTLWFVGVCPGAGIVRMLRIEDPLTVVILTIALSLSIGAMASVPLLWAGAWTAERSLAIVFAFSMIGAMADVWTMGRPNRLEADSPTISVDARPALGD